MRLVSPDCKGEAGAASALGLDLLAVRADQAPLAAEGVKVPPLGRAPAASLAKVWSGQLLQVATVSTSCSIVSSRSACAPSPAASRRPASQEIAGSDSFLCVSMVKRSCVSMVKR